VNIGIQHRLDEHLRTLLNEVTRDVAKQACAVVNTARYCPRSPPPELKIELRQNAAQPNPKRDSDGYRTANE
jgi:hypothetical protein